jgi:hypothetical protein
MDRETSWKEPGTQERPEVSLGAVNIPQLLVYIDSPGRKRYQDKDNILVLKHSLDIFHIWPKSTDVSKVTRESEISRSTRFGEAAVPRVGSSWQSQNTRQGPQGIGTNAEVGHQNLQSVPQHQIVPDKLLTSHSCASNEFATSPPPPVLV